MEKQNILSQGQDQIVPTKNQLDQNQLSQQASYPQQLQNQESSTNIQNELEDTNITTISEQTLLKKVKSQIVRRSLAYDRIFQNAIYQVLNQGQYQHAILSYQNQAYEKFIQHISSKNPKILQQDKNSQHKDFSMKQGQNKQKQTIIKQIPKNQNNLQYFKYFEQKTDINLQNAEKKISKQQNIKFGQTVNQGNDNQQEISQRKIFQQDNQCSQNDFDPIKCQIKQDQTIIKYVPNDQINCREINEKGNDNQQESFEKEALKQENNNSENHFSKKDDQIKNQLQSYSSQLKETFCKIEEYISSEYEKSFELEYGFFQVKKVWEEEIFERVNEIQTQSEKFKSQKQKIFEKLNEEQLYLCKIIYSSQLEDLILGFYLDKNDNLDEQENFNEYIFKIIYDPIQSDIDIQGQIIQTLGFQFKLIKLEQENISIFSFKKRDYLSFQNKFEFLLQFKSNIKQIESIYYEINSLNCQQCKECMDQDTCHNVNCFKNIKYLIIAFLKYKNKYSYCKYCEYQNNLIEGIIFQLNQDQFISEYLYFLHRVVFSFLKNNQIEQKNQNISEKKLSSSQTVSIKQKIDISLINEYSFKDYQIQLISDQNQEKENLSLSCQREWDINKFIELNKKEVNEFFLKQQMEIIQILKIKKYFLCKCFFSIQSENIFIGYQEQNQKKYIDYVFVIKYNPIPSEISKYFLIKQLNEELNYFIINNFAHVFIIQKDTFLQINNNFEYLSQYKIEWTKEYFENINSGKAINLRQCNKCEDCKQKKECSEYIHFTKFQEQKNIIFEKLRKKSYYICEYLTKGGEGLVFQGYRQSIKHKKQDYVFKILFEQDQNDLESEIKMMKMFDCHVNVIKFIDLIEINHETNILILEKCQFSLMDELKQLQQKQEFSLNKLLQMIFNLFDGLIQFRIYNILHLDIKPQNILLNYSGQYVYTDFGVSSLKKKNEQVQIKGWTDYYAPPEQKNKDLNIDYQSDVFSLGKTFKIILQYFQGIQQKNHKEIVCKLMKIVDEQMIQDQSKNRLNCLDLRNQFFKYILTQKECIQFLESYVDQINNILKSYPYDQNKEIPYFLQTCVFYELNILNFRKELIKSNQQNDIQQIQLDIVLSLNNVGSSYQKLGNIKKALEYQLESLQTLKSIFKPNHVDIPALLNNICISYMYLGDNENALEYSLESLQMTKQIFKENHHNIATSLSNVGSCYVYLDDNKKALKYYLKSLKMRKQIFKQNHPDIASSLNNVGACFYNIGEYKKAIEYLLESLKMNKQISKQNRPEIALSLNNLGYCYQQLGDYKKALVYQLESLEIRKLIFKENHPDIAASLNNVGNCYVYLGDNKKALEYQLESLQMRKQIFKENHPDIAASLDYVGSCYLYLGDNKKALEYLLESLQMRKQIFKENHPDIAKSLNNIGIYYKNIGDNKKALEYQLESLQIAKQTFKQNHTDIASYLNNVGSCYRKLGDHKKDLEYQLESLQMRKQIFKENHPDIAKSLNYVGSCYKKLGDNKKALEYYQESLQMAKQIFKENHPHIVLYLSNFGRCYQNIGDNKMALEYLFESLQMAKQIYQENHPNIYSLLCNIGQCYQNFGDYKKALEYYLEYLQKSKQIFKENHPGIAQSLNNISACYIYIGEYKKALEYSLESLKMYKQIYQENHPLIAVTLNNVGCCYRDFGDNKKALVYILESLEILKQKFKENNQQISIFLSNVVSCYENLFDDNIASEYQLEYLDIIKQISNKNQ